MIAVAVDEPQPQVWHGHTDNSTPAPRMSPDEAVSLVAYLATKVGAGYTIVTWNGLSFDFDVLAEESHD